MKTFAGMLALVAVFTFGPLAAFTYAGDPPAPAPTDEKGKPKPGAPKFSASDDKKDDKKDGKGGK